MTWPIAVARRRHRGWGQRPLLGSCDDGEEEGIEDLLLDFLVNPHGSACSSDGMSTHRTGSAWRCYADVLQRKGKAVRVVEFPKATRLWQARQGDECVHG